MKEDKIVFFRTMSDVIQMFTGVEKMFEVMESDGSVRLRAEEVVQVENALKEIEQLKLKVEQTNQKFREIAK